MSTLESIKSELQEIIADSNATTGGNAATVRDGVDALIDGYGGGSGGGAELNIHYGDTEPTDTSKLWCKCKKPNGVLGKADVDGTESVSSTSAYLPSGHSGMQAGVVGKIIYIFGGYSGGYKNTIYKFDTETETLTLLSVTLPSALGEVVTIVIGTKIYLLGGGNTSGYVNTICRFDTETETIETLSVTLPNALRSFGAGVVGTKIYIFGGLDGSAYSSAIYMLDTEAETITKLSVVLPRGMYYISVGVVGTKMYLFGGINSGANQNTIYKFDTVSETLTTLSATLPNRICDIGVGVIGTKIYLFGGTVSAYPVNTIYKFDASTETGETLSTTLPTKYNSVGVGTVGTKIYLFGGYNGSSSMSDIRVLSVQFNLSTNTLLLHTSLTNNVFNLIDGIEMGVENVYIGNSDGYGESVDSYLYQNGAWTQI
jgi:N-acetylneuraminic acid mutarotase